MIINLVTNETFRNRKEAKDKIGKFVYNRLLKEGKIIFTNNLNLSAICGTLCTNTKTIS